MATTEQYTGPASPEGLFRYDLSPEEVSVLEKELFSEIKAELVDGSMPVVVVDGHSKFADLGRTIEMQRHLKTMPEAMNEYEGNSVFLLITDPNYEQSDSPMVRHVLRITRASQAFIDRGKTGLASVDDLVFNLNLAEFEDVLIKYGSNSENPVPSFISIDSNANATPDDPSRFMFTVIGYKAVEHYCVENNTSFVFAEFNDDTTNSLVTAGVEFYPFMDNPDLQVPNLDEDGQNQVYRPFIIPVSKHNISLFEDPAYTEQLDVPYKEQAKFLASMPVQMIYKTGL